jgi:hypothetical protein
MARPRIDIWTLSTGARCAPLRSDADLDAAVAVVDSLIDRPELAAPE